MEGPEHKAHTGGAPWVPAPPAASLQWAPAASSAGLGTGLSRIPVPPPEPESVPHSPSSCGQERCLPEAHLPRGLNLLQTCLERERLSPLWVGSARWWEGWYGVLGAQGVDAWGLLLFWPQRSTPPPNPSEAASSWVGWVYATGSGWLFWWCSVWLVKSAVGKPGHRQKGSNWPVSWMTARTQAQLSNSKADTAPQMLKGRTVPAGASPLLSQKLLRQ
jgi:hypothetical protein